MSGFMRIEDLQVYNKLCQLHIDVCALTRDWPREERFELTSQVRRVRNKIEGVNRSRGEALETVHHLYVATMKGYVAKSDYESYRDRYHECVRMLNGMEKTLEKQLPMEQRRFPSDPEP